MRPKRVPEGLTNEVKTSMKKDAKGTKRERDAAENDDENPEKRKRTPK